MKIKRILFIVPPAITFKAVRDVNPMPPMGLGYLSSIALNLGIEVKIVNCLLDGWDIEEEVNENLVKVGLTYSQIANCISDFCPDIVGINCQFSRQYRIYHRVLSLVRDINPNIITIAGGAHVTVCPNEILKDINCDFIIKGEAEDSFKNFILELNAGRDFKSIDGLGWKKEGKIYINDKSKWITDLDTIPFPAYGLMNLKKYFGLSASHGLRHKAEFAPIITSRGCPARCTFCSANKVWGNSYRLRSVDNVIKEMRLLHDKYGIRELLFEDDNLTADIKRAKQLFCRMIDEKFDFVWDTPNGVGAWSLDYEALDLMKDSGCIKLNFPVESGSEHVLKNIIKKPVKLERIKQLAEYCRKIGLDYSMFFVVGMPGEKVEDIRKTFRFAAECKCFEPHVSIATPYPGTKLLDICLENHLLGRDYCLDDLFIRSYMIKTADWSSAQLEKVLASNLFLLKISSLVSNPIKALKRLFRAIREPYRSIKFFKDLCSSLRNTLFERS